MIEVVLLSTTFYSMLSLYCFILKVVAEKKFLVISYLVHLD